LSQFIVPGFDAREFVQHRSSSRFEATMRDRLDLS